MMKRLLFFFSAIALGFAGRTQENSIVPIEYHAEINSIADGGNDTLWLTLGAGANLGLQKGMKGTALQVYNSQGRKYTLLSPAWVTQVFAASAKAFVLAGDGNKKEYLVKGDHVVFPNIKARAEGNRLLQLLASFNITFTDSYKTPFYEQANLFKMAGEKQYDSLVTAFRKDITETAEYLKDMKEKPESWTAPLKGGKFQNTSLLDAMLKTTVIDVESFLNFVIDFPGKYIGNRWKISETYATWVLNDMPWSTRNGYLVPAFLRVPASQVSSWSGTNRFYIDTLKRYLSAAVTRSVNDKKFDSADLLISRANLLGEAIGDKPFLATMANAKGQALQQKGGSTSAAEIMKLYTKAIAFDSLNADAYWYRSSLLAEQERYNDAISDLKAVNRLVPTFASAWGNRGWYYMKQFKVKEAGPCCIKAYELDSSSSSWSVNLAHYYLLTGQQQKARTYYQKTLDNLNSESEFINGPLSDFVFFAEQGVLNDAFEKEKTWLLQQFDLTYRHYLRSDSLFAAAKEARGKSNYVTAAKLFLNSRESEKAATVLRNRNIHNITTWVGYMHYLQKEYPKSESYYQEALAMATVSMPEQLANDYDLMGDLYDAWGKKALTEAYKSQSLAWKTKSKEESTEKDLYIVSIGIDQYKDLQYNWAATDAEKLAAQFREKAKGFRTIYAHTLTNKSATSDSLDRAMQKIIAQAKEEDTFVFYFTGKASSNKRESFLLPFGLASSDPDTVLLKKAISPQLLRSWSNSIAARHQLFLLDAAASQFSSAFANQSTSLSTTRMEKDLLILSATFPRIEKPSLGAGIIAASMEKIFSEEQNGVAKTISGKKIESFFADSISRNNHFLPIESYSQGRDFVLSSEVSAIVNRSSATATDASALSRGGAMENTNRSGVYSLNKRYGLFIATDEYTDAKWAKLNNPIDDANELKKALEEEYGFEIEVVPNPTKTQIFNKIDEYSRKKYNNNDQLVVLFAGHGYYDSRRNEGYLVPSDATYTDIEFDRYYYPMSSIMRDLKIIPAKHMMVLVDACHGGAICDNALMRGDGEMYSNLSVEELLKNHLEYPNRLILTSGRKDQRVPDGIKGKNSPFISAILSALKSKEAKDKGMISYYQLMKYISEVQKTQATSAIFSPNDNWNFMFFHGGNAKKDPIANPGGRVDSKQD